MSTELNYDHARTMLILKHGSIPAAYAAFCNMSLKEQNEMDTMEYEIIMEYEYRREYGWP